MEINRIYNENCIDTMQRMPDNFVDLAVTSPPYDDLRDYKGYSFPFEEIARELFRVTKVGGIVVWVVGDATIKGSETGTSFRQALYFKEIGFNLHDTMIYHRLSAFPGNVRYSQDFEYMFVLSKGKPNTFNPIKERRRYDGFQKTGGNRKKNGKITQLSKNGRIRQQMAYINDAKSKVKTNIWEINAGFMKSTTEEFAFDHPAIFPEKLAKDHIISWSNENDLIYDPFMGSGTTAKMAILNKRNYIGSEMAGEYISIIDQRIKDANTAMTQTSMF